MDTHDSTASRRLLVAADVATILIDLSGALIGAFLSFLFAQGSEHTYVFVLIGIIIGGLVGYALSMPISALLTGFARIVEWYEAAPPGYVHIAPAEAEESANTPIDYDALFIE